MKNIVNILKTANIDTAGLTILRNENAAMDYLNLTRRDFTALCNVATNLTYAHMNKTGEKFADLTVFNMKALENVIGTTENNDVFVFVKNCVAFPFYASLASDNRENSTKLKEIAKKNRAIEQKNEIARMVATLEDLDGDEYAKTYNAIEVLNRVPA